MNYILALSNKMLSTQKLYQAIKEEKYDEAEAIIDDDPKVIVQIGWISISCAGAWGMPMYAHIGTFLDTGHEASGHSRKYCKNAQMRKLCEKIVEMCPDIFYNYNKEISQSLICNYALRAGWIDHLEACERDGFPIEKIKDLAKGVKQLPGSCLAFLHGERSNDRECCICMDAPSDARYYPCHHDEFCFACSRDLTTCPICRMEGYSKQVTGEM